MSHPRIALFLLVIFVTGAQPVVAQNYPARPVRLLAPAPGGVGDLVAREIAQGLTSSLGQQVIVDNRGTVLAADVVAKAPPDGYSLLFNGGFWLLPYLQTNIPWDPVKDFSPVISVAGFLNVLVVHPSLPVKSVKELIALARAKPGEINYASSSLGTSTHLDAELFKSLTGVNLVRIPYTGAGPAFNALLAGEAQVMFANASQVATFAKSGRLAILGVVSAKRSSLAPGIPTIAESGVPGYESSQALGVFAPAKTPAAVIARLNQDIMRILSIPAVREKFSRNGVEPIGSSPEQFGDYVKSDIAKMSRLIRDIGIDAK